jgi:hypothetical protein
MVQKTLTWTILFIFLALNMVQGLNWVQPKPPTSTANNSDIIAYIEAVNINLSNQITNLANISITDGEEIPMNVINKTTGTSWVGMTLDAILDWIYDWFQATDVKIDQLNQTMYDYMTYINGSIANISIQAAKENGTVTTTGGSGSALITGIEGFELKRIIVTTSNPSTSYRFEATEDITGKIIDKDRIVHTGNWDIIKHDTIGQDVFINITQSSPDDTFFIEVFYLKST